MAAYQQLLTDRSYRELQPFEVRNWNISSGVELDIDAETSAQTYQWSPAINLSDFEGSNLIIRENERWLAADRDRRVGHSAPKVVFYAKQARDLIAETCSRLSRNLNKRECEQYIGVTAPAERCTNWRIR